MIITVGANNFALWKTLNVINLSSKGWSVFTCWTVFVSIIASETIIMAQYTNSSDILSISWGTRVLTCSPDQPVCWNTWKALAYGWPCASQTVVVATIGNYEKISYSKFWITSTGCHLDSEFGLISSMSMHKCHW